MRTDNDWTKLRDHASSRITPGFAGRVMLAARQAESPLLVKQAAFCAATAALCLIAVAAFRSSADDSSRSLASWQEVASQASELDQSL